MNIPFSIFWYKTNNMWAYLTCLYLIYPKGPFREPEDVQNQRYKPFQPSLRVATSFTSLEEARKEMKNEEWVTRLNDNV